MRGSDCCQLAPFFRVTAASHGDVNSGRPLGHCKVRFIQRIVPANNRQTAAPTSKDNAMTITNSAGNQFHSRWAGLIAALMAMAFVYSGPVRAQDKDPLVAKVNGVEIHQSDLAVAEEEAGQLPPMSPEAKQDYLVQFVGDMILVSKAAEDKKFGDGADFKRKLEFARKKLLMEGLLQSVGKEALTDAAMHKVYDDAVKQISDEK